MVVQDQLPRAFPESTGSLLAVRGRSSGAFAARPEIVRPGNFLDSCGKANGEQGRHGGRRHQHFWLSAGLSFRQAVAGCALAVVSITRQDSTPSPSTPSKLQERSPVAMNPSASGSNAASCVMKRINDLSQGPATLPCRLSYPTNRPSWRSRRRLKRTRAVVGE